MQKRKLCDGITINPIGFGGIPVQRVSFEEANAVLNACLDYGIDFFETARGYTDSEEKIGKAISHRKNEFFIATKAFVTTKVEMEREIKTSLEKLNVKKIDLYQIHNVKEEERLNACLKKDGAYYALKEAQETGLIGHIGITGHVKEITIKAIETGKFETVQVPFNIVETPNLKVIEKANELGIGVIIMKPLAGGAFKNAIPALKWVLQHDVSVVIPGMDKVEQVKQNTALIKDYSMTKKEMELLTKEAKSLGKYLCRRCEYCVPYCPQKIPIPLIFVFHGYYKRYGLKQWAKDRYRDFVKVKADKCTECGACEKACPYNLPIIKLLKEAHRDLG